MMWRSFNSTISFVLPLFLLFVVSHCAVAEELTSYSFILRNPTIDTGGATSTSASFITTSFLGQNTPGESTSTTFQLQSGLAYLGGPIFTATAPGTINFSSLQVSTSAQEANATMSGVTVTNTRATTTAWSLTMAATNLTITGASSKIAGANDTVSFSGSYNGVVATTSGATIYRITITTGGAVGAAVFKWRDPYGTIITGVTTASSVALNSGVSVNFGSATYVTGDEWVLRVDSLGYTGLTVQPGTPTVSFGDTGITAGTSGVFSGSGATSDSRTLINGTAGSSNGGYVQSSALIQTVHANTLQGTFSGTITLTLS